MGTMINKVTIRMDGNSSKHQNNRSVTPLLFSGMLMYITFNLKLADW